METGQTGTNGTISLEESFEEWMAFIPRAMLNIFEMASVEKGGLVLLPITDSSIDISRGR